MLVRPKIDAFITLYKNPAMARLVVESINASRKPRDMCIWGFFEHGFDPNLEPIFDLLECETRKVKREKKYGINWNTPSAFKQLGCETQGEYVICLQSDIVVSKDFFEFIDHGFAHFENMGYVFGFAYPNGPDEDDVVSIQCHPGWYGHWGIGVNREVIKDLYCKYFVEPYPDDVDKHAREHFPDIKCGGSDYFASKFLYENGIRGIRPACSRVTNIGIHGEHIRLKGATYRKWERMSHEDKVASLRKILDSGHYDFKSNFQLSRSPRILRDYKWHDFKIIEDHIKGGKHTGTDL